MVSQVVCSLHVSCSCINHNKFIWNPLTATDTTRATVHLPLIRSFSRTRPSPWFRLIFRQTEGVSYDIVCHDTILRNRKTSVQPTPDTAPPALSAHGSLWHRDSVLYSISLNIHSRYTATDWRTFGGPVSGFVVVEFRWIQQDLSKKKKN